ncbi:hypothetical protein ACFL1N_04805 [Thermodesulfobacteriota bacterium]
MILVVFLSAAIYPFHRNLASLDKDLIKIKNQIDKQKIIYPFFREMINKINKENSFDLPFPKKADFDRKKIQMVPSIYKEMASDAGLTLVKVDPDIRVLTRIKSDILSSSILLKGDFFNFRRCLVMLGGLPYLESVEEIRIESTKEEDLFSLKINLYIGK